MQRRTLRVSLTLYAALLVGPAAVALPGPQWPLFAAGCLVGGVAGALASGRIDSPDQLLGIPIVVIGILLPLGWLIPMVQTADSVIDLLVSPWFAGACAVGFWLLALVAAHTIRQERRIDSLTEIVSFEARPPPSTRRQLKLALGAIVTMMAIAVVTFALLGFDSVSFTNVSWLPAMFSVLLLLVTVTNSRQVAVTDQGIRVQQTIHDWESFDGYELTDEALELSRSRWYHSDLEFDREDIDTLPAVLDALDEHFEAS